MLPPRQAHRSRSADRVRWALTMLSAVALAFVVTRQPRVVIERRGRGLVEGDLLPGSRTRGSGGAASSSFADRRSSGGARGVSAARGDAQLHLGGDGGSGSSSGGGSDAVGSEADPDLEPQLEGRAACIAEATTMPPPVQGWVKKAGALPMRLLDGPQTRARHQAYFRWRDSGNLTLLTQETQVDGQPARVARAPPLFPYCRILVNHAYRTMYLKAPKTGSTSLLTLLGTCTGGAGDKATCFEPLKPLASKEQYEALYRDYFVFAVVRNPWQRAVSSYRMLARYMRRTCGGLVGGWSRVCADLNLLGRLHHRHPECTLHKQQGEGFAMHHLIPQAPCLVTEGGEWAADYVVRMENMQEDVREVLQQMDQRRSGEAPRLDVEGLLAQLTNVNGLHVACRGGLVTDSNATIADAASARRRRLASHGGPGDAQPDWLEAPESYCNEAQYYLGPHGACFDALRAYYSHDVELFRLPQCSPVAS